ncbi:MAG: DUF4886 domain-containing protein [Leadbetterella sp.]|nr:DUF4886 domain-containing protein [Leadbetterella sp.]
MKLFNFLMLSGILSLGNLFAQPMRVLFVGNSYTHYNNMPKILEQMAESKGVKLEVLMDAKSSHTFQMHSKRPELYKNIRSTKWDYVVLQGFSRELAQDRDVIDKSSLPYLKQLLDSVYANNSCTNVLLYQTWGYETGFKDDSLGIDWNYQTMSDRIHQGYLYVSEQLNLSIVPVGKAWETVKENHPQINLYQEDKQHPSLAGSYLAASCFYAALFKTDPYVTFTAKLDTKQAGLIQETAGTYILMNKNRYKINQNSIEIDVKLTDENKKVVHLTANYPNAKSVTWDFGDGMTETALKTRHVYGKPGNYEVKIKVQDSCGERLMKRKVSI